MPENCLIQSIPTFNGFVTISAREFFMKNIFLLGRVVLFVVLGILLSSPAQSAPKYLFKLASIAPEGSVWTKRFQGFVAEVEAKSQGEVGFKVYPGGVMGDDRAMYRKMRVGQLHGGGFTMTGIGSIVPDFRVMGIPFLFRSYEEVDKVREGLWPSFSDSFAKKGLELMAFTEVGFAYTMSTFPIASLDDLHKGKTWTPEGDPVSSSYLEELGVSPVQLSIPDVLISLQTGMVDTVFNSFYGSIVLQWFTKTKYIFDIPFAYAYGAFLLDRKTFLRLPAHHALLMKDAARRHFGLLLQDTRESNREALEALQQNGAILVKVDPGTDEKLRAVRNKTIQNIRGKAFSEEILEATLKILDGT
jgi:TRAP-type C4-dicarboxylate transport system substrate-binding protein